jgi:hypothetical protein
VHSFQTFGQYSEFLRSAVADEESLQMGENLQALAARIEDLGKLLRQHSNLPALKAQAFLGLLDDLRSHRELLNALSADWRGFYEYGAHCAGLTHFRTLLTQWTLEAAPPRQAAPAVVDFDLAAWRVLGAGALLLDVYEHARSLAPSEQATSVSAWKRLTTWLRRR